MGNINISAKGDNPTDIRKIFQQLSIQTNGNFVPYSGAVTDVDLGSKDLSANEIVSTNLTGNRIVYSDGSKILQSISDLTDWISGTINQITSSSDGDGSITLSTPQDIHSGASPTFETVKLTNLSGGYVPYNASGSVGLANTNIFYNQNNGNVSISGTNPTARLHLPAGNSLSGSAPFKFTSGALLSNPEVGSIEFLLDKYFATITTANERKEIKLVDRYYGEMCNYENTNATTIGTQDVYHAVNHFSCPTAYLDGFTFVSGLEGSIASVSDYSGTVTGAILITDVAHGLTTNDIITIHSTTNYNGTFVVTKVTDDTFYVINTYVSDETGEWAMGSYLRCSAGSDGMYRISMSNTSWASVTNNTFKFEMNKNEIPLDNMACSKKYSHTDYSSLSTSGLVSLVEGDRIWMSCKNQTSSSDITVRHCNINISRL